MSFTIGSLFDGSGGFPLAATMCGGTPKWSSEIEPYPIAVTKSRFPDVKHLGSVTDIKGSEVEPVDVITFGSPCQDLSVAGKRAGLKHDSLGDGETTRSGLFMEAIRIIKEMREATNGVYPRFAIYENVPGAFSSNSGRDFRIVLEELIKIVEPTAVMPEVPKNGWPYADSYCGDGWSIAYRVLDAQYWGVPQRRRRIYLVADFRGQCARKVSFEREGLRGYFETGRTPWQTATGDAEGGSGATDCERKCYGIDHAITTGGNCTAQGSCVYEDIQATLKAAGPHAVCYAVDQGGGKSGANSHDNLSPTLTCTHGGEPVVAYPTMVLDDQGGSQISVRDDGKCPTLRAEMHGNVPCVLDKPNVYSVENHPADSRVNIDDSGKVQTLTSRMGTGGGNVPMVMEPIPIHDQATRFSGKRGDKADGKGNGLGIGSPGDHMNTLTSGDRHAVAYCVGNGQLNQITMAEQANTLDCMHDQQAVMQPYQSVIGALCSTDYKWVQQQQVEQDKLIVERQQIRYIVRRLTPTECARLQGFADAWAVPDRKDEFTDEEYRFWLEVRNTHAAINGKTVKDYTKEQMLTWYNKLHTDGSEYKLWGNGIALPNALYMMQGISDVMAEEKAARRKWLNDLLGGCL